MSEIQSLVPTGYSEFLAALKQRIQSKQLRGLSRQKRESRGRLFALTLWLGILAVSLQNGTALNFNSISHRVWQVPDGLPQSAVQCLAQTADGYLWIGTSSGLIRFDGSRFVIFNHETDHAFADDSVWSLFSAHDGALWIGTEGGGLLRYSGEQFVRFGKRAGLSNGFVRSVYEDRQSKLWVGTDDGLFERTGNSFSRVDSSRTIPPISVYTIRGDDEGTLYVGGSGLLEIKNSTATLFRSRQSARDEKVGAVQPTPSGALWVGTFAHLRSMPLVAGVDPFQAGRIVQLQPSGSERDGKLIHISVLMQAADGALWIGTYGEGVARYSGGHFRWFQSPAWLPDNNVGALLQDSEGDIWVGTQNGLVRLKQTDVATLRSTDNSALNVSTVYADPAGGLLAATLSGHLLESFKSSLHSAKLPLDIRDLSVRTTFRDSHGTLWIGTAGQGLIAIDKTQLQRYSEPDFIRAFAEDGEGRLWIGTDGGIGYCDAGRFQWVSKPIPASVRALAFDKGGELWIGTDNGLARISGVTVRQKDAAARVLKGLKVWSLYSDYSGNVWIGTRGAGLFVWDGSAYRHYTTRNGLPSDTIYSILDDTYDNLWMSSPDSLWSVRRKDLLQDSDAAHSSPAFRTYPTSDGNTTAQMSGGVQPAGSLCEKANVCFASSDGVIQINPVRDRVLPLPPIRIEQVTEDGKRLTSTPVVINPAAERVEIEYTAIRLSSPERIRFRYKMEGFEAGWTDAGSRRIAYYTKVPPGLYRFRLLAYNLAAPGNVAEGSIAIRFDPHFYQTAWFYGLCGLAGLCTTALAVHLRDRRVHERFDAVLKERNRVAREMHDTLIQGCIGVSTLLEAADSMRESYPEKSRGLIGRARTQIKGTVDEARNAVLRLRHDEEAGGNLQQMIYDMAAAVGEESAMPISVRAVTPVPPMSRGKSENILLILREAVYNAVRHASAKTVSVSFSYENRFLQVQVSDDGHGFRTEEPNGFHYGLTGMRERVADLRGELRIASSAAQGTTVYLRVPLEAGRT